MARRRVSGDSLETELMAETFMFSSWAKGPRKHSTPNEKTYEKKLAGVRRMVKADDWGAARPETMVLLYAWLHEETYGVRPMELWVGARWSNACKMAGSLSRRVFDGDLKAQIEFIRWVWGREAGRYLSGGKINGSRRRISWHDQFSGGWLLTDYLAETAGKRGSVKK